MNRIEEKTNVFFSILLVAGSCLSDLLHDGVDLGDAPWVDGSALLLTSHTADVGSNVVKDGGESDVDNVSLAEGGGNGELILIELVQGLGVEVADKELGAIVNVLAVLLKENGVEVSSLTLAESAESTTSVSVTTSTTSSEVAGKGSLGSAVDEALADEDLSSDDDGSSGDELSVDDGHGSDEGEYQEKGLHFAVSGFLAFAMN